jgi:ribulose 1,5-bisphosphate synthetase/thiazole synthase
MRHYAKKPFALITVLLTLALTAGVQAAVPPSDALLAQYDVVVAGAGAGGVAAAIQAARSGARVALLEETDWIGGQMTAAGVTALDEGTYSLREAGLYAEFVNRVKAAYQVRNKAVNTCHFRADSIAFESKVGADILFYSRVSAVRRSGATITGVTVETRNPGSAVQSRIVATKILIDATEYGDVIPLAGARYRSGNTTSDALATDRDIQDITYVGPIKRYPNSVP